jgi:hypothetical protein
MSAAPEIVTRTEQPYVAIRARVPMAELGGLAGHYPEVFGWLGVRGLAPAGAPFFKYNFIDMERELEVEAGVPNRPQPGTRHEQVADRARVPAGRLGQVQPAGRLGQVQPAGRLGPASAVRAQEFAQRGEHVLHGAGPAHVRVGQGQRDAHPVD